jgi:hypothetical protein
MPLGNGPSTLAVLQAMRGILVGEALVGGVSPFAALAAADQARYGVAVAVFIGVPKDFKDAYLPQCTLWVPPRDEAAQPSEVLGYAGRVTEVVEVLVTAYVDLRTDWYAGEQQILQIRDALWPALHHHERLGGTVATVIESWAEEGEGLGYEEVAGVEYRTYEARWFARQQWVISGGRAV